MCDVIDFPAFDSFPVLLITEAFVWVLGQCVFDADVPQRLKYLSKDERRALHKQCTKLRGELGDQFYLDVGKPSGGEGYFAFWAIERLNVFDCLLDSAREAAND